MSARRHRLDRFICQHTSYPRKQVRLLIAQQRILVDGKPAESISQVVDEFARIELDGCRLAGADPVYLMLHKPVGVVTAVTDSEHRTVIDLIDHPLKDQLHHVGRLDLNTSGLLLLTNDGQFSKRLTHPDFHVEKQYQVKLAHPITEDYVRSFKEGIYFAYEDQTTRPARLEIMSETEVRVTLTEGKYHQVKRMFGHFRNQVVGLHRLSVGHLKLDPKLSPGEWRILTDAERCRLLQDTVQAERQSMSAREVTV